MPVLQLLIPDDALRGAITEQLGTAGIATVQEIGDLASALGDEKIAAVLLGEEAANAKNLKLLREADKKKPVFLLGALKENGDSDAITETFPKPLRLGHLLSRLQFYLNVAPRRNGAAVAFGPYRLEPQNRQLSIDGKTDVIRLTEKETALLDYIAQSEKPVSREELLAAIWGYDAQIDTHTLETHIYQLRRKLDPEGTGANWLVNEQGAYRLERGDKAA